jgi:hypothetical protein
MDVSSPDLQRQLSAILADVLDDRQIYTPIPSVEKEKSLSTSGILGNYAFFLSVKEDAKGILIICDRIYNCKDPSSLQISLELSNPKQKFLINQKVQSASHSIHSTPTRANKENTKPFCIPFNEILLEIYRSIAKEIVLEILHNDSLAILQSDRHIVGSTEKMVLEMIIDTNIQHDLFFMLIIV